MPPTVSVIIPTYNRCSMLMDCLASVLRSDYQSFEVIVVDNASTDDTETAVQNLCKTCPEVRYLRQEKNLMAAGGRNAGAKASQGEFLLFLDNDNIVEPAMIRSLIDVLERKPAAGLAGALSIQASSGTIWTLGSDYDFLTSRPVNLHEKENLADVELQSLYRTKYSPNAMLIPRRIFEETGGFDEFYEAMYEEADLGFRITEAGREAFICADARTLHLGYVGGDQEPALRRLGIETVRRTYCFARNRSIFMRRFAPWYGQLLFFTIFAHVFTLYYCAVALRNRRPDIALAYLTGTLRGFRHAAFDMPPRPERRA